jgi:carboxymethylenebutenolidase
MGSNGSSLGKLFWKKRHDHCSEGDGTSLAPGIQEAAKAIKASNGTVQLLDYPGTRHAFFNNNREDVYDSKAAENAWQETVDFLNMKLI